MRYFDTSYLVPLVLLEPTSGVVASHVESLEDGGMATSVWTKVEFSSVLGIRVRAKLLKPDEARKAERGFEDLMNSFVVLGVDQADFGLAIRMLEERELGLRSGDALHLAIARNCGAEALLSLDKTLLRSARHFGVHGTTGAPITGYET